VTGTRAAARRANLAALRRIVDTRHDLPLVVLGDFNAGPDAEGVRMLLDAGLVDPLAPRQVKTTDDGRVDYLLVGSTLAPAVVDSDVWRSRTSDHNAVVADLRW